MSWTPSGQPAGPEPMPVERVIWRVTKDARAAEARVRAMAHGLELRFVVMRPGGLDTLMWSRLYRAGEGDDLRAASDGTLRDFERVGWVLEAEADATAQ